MNLVLKTGLVFKDIDSGRIYHGDLFYIEGQLRIHGVPRAELEKKSDVIKENFMMLVSLESSARQERIWQPAEGSIGTPSRWIDFTNVVIISVTPAFIESMERINPRWVKKHAKDYAWWQA
jgi:hypothetical protein